MSWNLHISKINDITIIQGHNSTLTTENKKADVKNISKGANKQVDLGKGSKTLKIEILVQDKNNFDEIYRILDEDRKATLTDKFLGELKVSIINFTINHSDSFLNLTKINISCRVEEDFKPNVNYVGVINRLSDNILDNIQPEFNEPIQQSVEDEFKDEFTYFINTVLATQTDYLKLRNRYWEIKAIMLTTLKQL